MRDGGADLLLLGKHLRAAVLQFARQRCRHCFQRLGPRFLTLPIALGLA
ncbi:hypothetical protein LP419_09485 [Massilia sp. H-1]|nr:hypothetical protein LP419_09485 [Massilia sp. H-1]